MENKVEEPKLSAYSKYILPILVIFDIVVTVVGLIKPNFNTDIESFVAWIFFFVQIAYDGFACFDVIKRKEKNLKTYTLVCAILNSLFATCFIVLYMV